MYRRLPSLDDLIALCAVDEHDSVSAAARALGRQQQTVSAQVKRAEQQMGIAVFDRSPWGTTTTAAGRKVIAATVEFLAAATLLDARLATLRDADAGPHRLTVAVSHTVAELYYPGWAATFHTAHPEVQLVMVQANSSRVRELVTTGEAPVGIVEGGARVPGLVETVLGEDELIVVAPTGHPWAEPGVQVGVDDLRSTPLVVREPGSGSREVTESVLGHLAEPAGEFGSLAAQRSGIISLHSPGIIAAGAVADAIALGRLARVDAPGLRFRRDLTAVHRRDTAPDPATSRFLELARQEP